MIGLFPFRRSMECTLIPHATSMLETYSTFFIKCKCAANNANESAEKIDTNTISSAHTEHTA